MSRISPTSSSITSSRVATPEGAALGVDHAGHVGAAPLELLQGVVQEVVGADRREGPDPLVLDRPVAPRLVGLEHVLDVEVADQLAVVADHREPAEAGGGAERLDVRAGRAAADGLQGARAASAPSSTVFSVKPEGAREPVVLAVLEQALAARLLDQRGDLLAGVRRADLVHEPHADQPQHARGQGVDADDDRVG